MGDLPALKDTMPNMNTGMAIDAGNYWPGIPVGVAAVQPGSSREPHEARGMV